MFTIENIKQAHSKVKSGADFPAYIREIEHLGVQAYTTFLHDGHTEFTGQNNYHLASEPKYATTAIADQSNPEAFRQHLQAHQQGQSNYLSFCQQAASTGVEKWTVSMRQKTVTYFNKQGQPIVTENIPG